ncbi:isochorismatase family protein [Brevirhabdus sp.]|uniref:isochorismatase family protein n=1 Tax=Brevirhabdus sp. TaxID=2004514 RepID=UPI004059F073
MNAVPAADSSGRSTLLLIDLQARLMPAIHDGRAVTARVQTLARAARLLALPVLYTEQSPAGLGRTIETLSPQAGEPIVEKMMFDACRGTDLMGRITTADVVVVGCEAHVCVMQTVLGLLAAGKKVHLVADAIGSRDPRDRDLAITRARQHGADVLSAEMAIFEWLSDARHPRFREVLDLVK